MRAENMLSVSFCCVSASCFLVLNKNLITNSSVILLKWILIIWGWRTMSLNIIYLLYEHYKFKLLGNMLKNDIVLSEAKMHMSTSILNLHQSTLQGLQKLFPYSTLTNIKIIFLRNIIWLKTYNMKQEMCLGFFGKVW